MDSLCSKQKLRTSPCTLYTYGRFGPLLVSLAVATLTAGLWLSTPAWADPFSFSTGNPDGLLGALTQPARADHLGTETADDFFLTATTSITKATILGLLPAETSGLNINNVEVEIYHVFPEDSVDPPSGNVPMRTNSPADVEIDDATRDETHDGLGFATEIVDDNFSVANTVVDGINKAPGNMTTGEGPVTGEMVQITIDLVEPIVLPPGHYFFRPQVEVDGADFLWLSAPKPIVAPGTPVTGDLQAWIRNSDLEPDWLRIGTDIIGGSPAPTFNMTLMLTGNTIADEATPTATVTPTETPEATATPTTAAQHNGNSGCSITTAPSGTLAALWPLLLPAAILWRLRRRRG